MKVSPADLLVFLTIARHHSFRAAAVELGVSPSALSHSLRGLEERLDLRLFNRTTRSVALTEAGQRLFARIDPAFRDIAGAIEDLDNLRGKPTGTLRINSARQSAQLVLLPIITEFLSVYPDVKIELATDDQLVDMVSSGFDAGVRFGETIAADMIAVPIGPKHRFAVVASPKFFKDRSAPTTPHDLRSLPCVRFKFLSGSLYRWEFELDGKDIAIEVDGPLTLNDQDLMLQAARDGVGLAYVFEAQAAELIRKKKLVRVLDDWCPAYPGFYLYYPSRRQMPMALRAFVDFVKARQGKQKL